MSIIGIGSDIVSIARFEKLIARRGIRGLQRIFHTAEIECYERKLRTSSHAAAAALAKRFAAKEAFAKAMGSGFGNGLYWRDVWVENEPVGKPLLKLSGGAFKQLSLLPRHGDKRLHLSLSDDGGVALAFVIIERA